MMKQLKVLIVCSMNSGRVVPFIADQVESLKNQGVDCDYFGIKGKGIRGYLKNRKKMLARISAFKPDIIHAHYSLSGLLANTQWKIPVVTTYHGSDINDKNVLKLSKLNMILSKMNIFVSEKNIRLSGIKKNFTLIPCGVDTNLFKPVEKSVARNALGYKSDEKLMLFAGALNNEVKNPELALKVASKLVGVRMIELKNFTRQEVSLLMNAVDVCLMTSFSEGSPQFVKEAMACNCPVVTVDVGDVKENLTGIKQCFVTNYDADKLAACVKDVLNSSERSDGRDKINDLQFDAEATANKIIGIYRKLLERKKK